MKQQRQTTMNKIKERKKRNAVCPKCKSPDYKYIGLSGVTKFGKHQFKCNSCNNIWQYGSQSSVYFELA